MTDPSSNPVPTPPIVNRGAYVAFMAGTISISVAVGVAVAMVVEGGRVGGGSQGDAALGAALTLVIGCLPSLLPGLLHVKAENWGTLVFGSSVARMLFVVALAGAIGLTRWPSGSPDRKAYLLGVVVGAILNLTVETIASLTILSRRDRTRMNASLAGAASAALLAALRTSP